MKKIIVLGLSICTASISFAQQAELAIAKAKYTFSHVLDTNKRDKPYTEEMLLIIGKNSSLYTSNVRLEQQINFKKHVAEQIRNNGGTLNGAQIISNRKRPTIETDYYIFNQENKFYTVEKLMREYLTEEEIPKIDWKINKDTLTFSGLKCQKATANFKGRNWIAWFAPELPFPNGPWKLNGLPGLIVDAYDEKKEVQFKFAGFEAVKVNPIDLKSATEDEKALTTAMMGNEIRIPVKALKVSAQELNRLKKAKNDDPYGFAKAQLAGTGMEGLLNITKQSFGNRPVPTASQFNNPIELK
ncbi:GLPGLI family protein [Pedobacter ureilyticus]|uniref:GLPGLI family protein n=1 Tax=Pedobacter ureilyticus TaxID=1393051 RepID=A0ABW9JD89_9SPHI|nr:GLPGLI family protein [Pedobacter helvus]